MFDRRRTGWILIDVDHSPRWTPCGLEHLAEEPFGGARVSFRARHEINRLPRRVDGAIAILPLTIDFDISLIDAAWAAHQSQVRTNSFLCELAASYLDMLMKKIETARRLGDAAGSIRYFRGVVGDAINIPLSLFERLTDAMGNTA